RVILIRDEQLLDGAGVINKDILSRMLDEAVVKLTQAGSADQAWKQLIKPTDVLGIKTNQWNNLPTPAELEQLLKERALKIGIKEQDISIADRSVLRDPVFMRATALINTRPMRTHAWSGVGSLLKNYIMFTPQPASYHGDSCADLAKLWELPEVKGKTRLNILVMITPQFHNVGSHHFSKEFVWPYKGLVVSFDPVAADAVGLQIIEARRRQHFGESRPLNPPAKHIQLAETRHHLGFADAAKIELIRAGWTGDILI
ncbi:MAG: DUF362 domain-containing protein, partial [Bacteroidales bacterium]|nr:DUF362 domain-containing protein [Bacteroidales bacterium]